GPRPDRDSSTTTTAGIDEPDRRGRTGPDRIGRDLPGNDGVRFRDVELLSTDWYVLRRTTFDMRHRNDHWSTEQRETYDRGIGRPRRRPATGSAS
ncbi:MAG: nudK, partial [Modestobacter sp.]|nr:nudK [Modestobacter sp.]